MIGNKQGEETRKEEETRRQEERKQEEERGRRGGVERKQVDKQVE